MSKDEVGVCEEQVYKALYLEHAQNITNYIYYKYGDLEKAKDVVQESYAKLWINCSKIFFKAAKSFLYKTANNTSINEYHHQQIVLKYQNQPVANITNESPEFQMEEKEFRDKVQTAINSLKEGQREVFLLNRIEKKTYKEIAELLNISVKTVEKRMHLALKEMRTQITQLK
ncbi:sigma-70 family RNA polymerase sigma factor [Aquimarina sp. ERC-38]|uniref:RNA polymerase sigma factor n=1 Tax=Aquimarina sp. ERC-38 TaxID=2949996 RepID=UPI002247C9E6|nr:sigma-70 family RNA polymerase sigma factor [Aquimarina sp. ERC-38]UZO80853.1 sigma-70 family RNA polymerase sigma factor [Aquimarina sp. ERC-38]